MMTVKRLHELTPEQIEYWRQYSKEQMVDNEDGFDWTNRALALDAMEAVLRVLNIIDVLGTRAWSHARLQGKDELDRNLVATVTTLAQATDEVLALIMDLDFYLPDELATESDVERQGFESMHLMHELERILEKNKKKRG